MTLRWPWSDVERAKKSYRLFCERPVGGNGLETLQAVSVQLKQMDNYLKTIPLHTSFFSFKNNRLEHFFGSFPHALVQESQGVYPSVSA